MDDNALAMMAAERDILCDIAAHLQKRLSEAHCAERNARDLLTLEHEQTTILQAERDEARELAQTSAAKIAELEESVRNLRMRLARCEDGQARCDFCQYAISDVHQPRGALRGVKSCRAIE